MSALQEFDEWYKKEEAKLLLQTHTLRQWLEFAFRSGAAVGYREGYIDAQEEDK